MDLLQLLMGTMTSNSSLNSVSQRTGVSTNKTNGLLQSAVPVLISYLTKNASSQQGAASLANALTQHTSTASATSQLMDADEADGALIIKHILGDDQQKVVSNLRKKTGLTTAQVNTTLNTIAPYLLSSLSNATTAATQQVQTKKSSGVDLSDGFDLTDVMGLLGGSQQTQQSSGGLLSSLLGGGQKQSSGGLGSLLGSLISTDTSKKTTTKKVTKTQPQSNGLDMNSILGLLGGTSNTQQTQSSVNGNDLLNILTSLVK